MTPSGIVIESLGLVQYRSTLSLIANPPFIVRHGCESSLMLHPSNAFSPISVTPSGISTDVSDVHPSNALSPISVMLGGISTDESDVQS